MDLLQSYADFEEEVEEKEDHEVSKPAEISSSSSFKKWVVCDDDDDDDNEDDNDQLNNQASKDSEILIDNLLANTEPNNFKHSATNEFYVPAFSKVICEPKKSYKGISNTSSAQAFPKSLLDRKELTELSRPIPSHKVANKDTPNVKNPKANRAEDKETAKDRVKRQRMSGQSGIGEDFKTWRSEEEMRLRQTYD